MDIQKTLQKVVDLRDKKGKPEEALDLLLTLEIPEDYQERIEYLGHKAVLCRDVGKMTESLTAYQQVANLAEENGDLYTQLDILRSLAFWSLIQDKSSNDCKKYADQAQKLASTLKPKTAKEKKVFANVYAALGNVEFEYTKDNNKALDYYEKGLKYAKEAQFTNRIITIVGDIANVYVKTDRVGEAQKLLDQILPEAEKHYRLALPQILLRFAKLHKNRAKELAKQAQDISQKEGWDLHIQESTDLLDSIK